jgi:polyisoprenoid-binding protein YceI
MNTVNLLLLSITLLSQLPPKDAPKSVDTAHSTLRIHVAKTGLFSAFGHNHEIEAPIESGEVVESGKLSVSLRVDARKLKVLDPDDPKSRPQVQETMLGPQVLDSTRYPEIRFESEKIESKGPNHWVVTGRLTLHSQTRPISFDVALADKVYRGTATIKQTEFGMTPVSVAGGSVRVKNEVKVEFAIGLKAD